MTQFYQFMSLVPNGMEYFGFIPEFLTQNTDESFAKQIDAGYQHGGGWNPQSEFKHVGEYQIKYPGDPVFKPKAIIISSTGEALVAYDYGYIGIFQKDGTFEVARCD